MIPYPISTITAPLAPLFGSAPLVSMNFDERRSNPSVPLAILFGSAAVMLVSMRMSRTAGQRNAAAVHYHFGSKDDLLRELLIDGAELIDAGRRALFDELEARGQPTLTEVVRAMVLPNIELRGPTGEHETCPRFGVPLADKPSHDRAVAGRSGGPCADILGRGGRGDHRGTHVRRA